MPGLIDSCEKYFGSKDLYEILRISRTATTIEVRKAYHRLSLLVHPDRVSEEHKLSATEKFKILGKIHSILSDKSKRAIYDKTGSWDDEDNDIEDGGVDWCEYWRMLFKEITIEDISNYEKKYKGSDIELSDLKRAYMDRKGDMNYILEAVPFTNTEEEPRLREIIERLINSGEVPAFHAFVNETPEKKQRRKRKWEKEAQQAARIEAELERQRKEKNAGDGCNDEDELSGGLEKAILERKKNREVQMNSFFDQLAAKYGSPKQKQQKKTTPARKCKK